jgi:hypothetical protein
MTGYTLSLRSDGHRTTGSPQWPGLCRFGQMLNCTQSEELSVSHECALGLQGSRSAYCLTQDSLGGNNGGDAAAMPTRNINWPR